MPTFSKTTEKRLITKKPSRPLTSASKDLPPGGAPTPKQTKQARKDWLARWARGNAPPPRIVPTRKAVKRDLPPGGAPSPEQMGSWARAERDKLGASYRQSRSASSSPADVRSARDALKDEYRRVFGKSSKTLTFSPKPKSKAPTPMDIPRPKKKGGV
jgi:hypothetical protein